MREIKFRAWDKTLKRWKFTDILDLIFKESSLDEDCQEFICQYTGLKDKNGKEIYEGDILKIGSAVTEAIVKFKDGNFYSEDNEGGIWSNFMWGKYIVIGNIYENSNLLK